MHHNALTEAFLRCATDSGGDHSRADGLGRTGSAGCGTDETWHAPLDHSTVLLGYPGLYDGLVLSHWTDDGRSGASA